MMTTQANRHCFLLREAELLVWCARTELTDDLKTRIRQRVQASLRWSVLLDMAHCHGVVPLLYRNLSTVASDLVPEEPLAQLRKRAQVGALLNRSLAQELIVLCKAFQVCGVPVIPIKGATLAVLAYGDLSLRDFTDLDLLVPQGSVAEAQAVLLSHGYEKRAPPDRPHELKHDDGPYHVFIKRGTLSRVDIQWVMAHQHFTFRLDRPEFWQHQISFSFESKTIQSLAVEDLLIVLCVHGTKHAWEYLKWVCDVAEILRAHPDLDWERCLISASNWHCQRMLYMGLSLAHLVLDAPLPEAVLARLQDDSDVRALSYRMPASLLSDNQEGVTEEQGGALYFSLKDSWWDRWWCGLLLCRGHSHVATNPPSWFRWRRSLPFLASAIIPAHRAMQHIISPTIRGAISRWVPHSG
jgi:hypothetical protein